MAHSFLVFNFGADEDSAQQARHRIDGWRQAFRLDKKLQLKFDRKAAKPHQESDSESSPKKAKGNSESKSRSKANKMLPEKAENAEKADSQPASEIHLIVRLDFSDHEKLSHQRWLERIPAEEPFKVANPQVIKSGDPKFAAIAELFDSLDSVDGSLRAKF